MATNIVYGGSKGSASTATIKSFNLPIEPLIWTQFSNTSSKFPNLGTPTIFPTSTSPTTSVFIPGNLEVDGIIYGTVQPIPSDSKVKTNIADISPTLVDPLLTLDAKQFTYITDTKGKLHYGFIAQDVEKVLPNLIDEMYDQKTNQYIKTVNYLEMVPLLVAKIQDLQSQIDELKKA
jgi:hypothetical protein